MGKTFLAVQLGLVITISAISKYQIPDFKDVNWDIVLFLTPYGIINNFINKENTVMWSFYSDISPGQIQLSTLQIFTSLAVYFFMAGSVYYYSSKNS